MQYQHLRKNRVCGSYVDLGWGKGLERRPRINGLGIFEVSDKAPDNVHAMLKNAGHIPINSPEEIKRPAPELPKPESKLIPNQEMHTKPTYQGYPENLTEIPGVGAKTAKTVGAHFKTPRDLLRYAERNKRGPGSIAPGTWNKIRDYVESKWSE